MFPTFATSRLQEILAAESGTTWARNGRWILPENARLPRNIQGSFTCRKSMTWDWRLYFPSEGRFAEDFFALKNPTVSAGFEPANLGTKGQHATSRPPKLQFVSLPLTSSSTLTMQTLALTINYLVRSLWTREVPVDLWSAWTLGVSVVFWTDLPVSFSGICYCRVINVYNRSCFCLQVANYTMF